MDSASEGHSFRGLLLQFRGRTRLIQRDLATRAGVSRRSVQDWEGGVTVPTAERLRGLIGALLAAGCLTEGRERSEAHQLWAAAEREARRSYAPFDDDWLASLLAGQRSLSLAASQQPRSPPESARASLERAQDWGDAPDAIGFVGRSEEIALLHQWVMDERCGLVMVVGMGGIGKTTLAARAAQDVGPGFERVYWRSLRNAPPVTEWLSGTVAFVSDQQLVPPTSEAEK